MNSLPDTGERYLSTGIFNYERNSFYKNKEKSLRYFIAMLFKI